jgi:quercetin dioxygenase-like cupin family protein
LVILFQVKGVQELDIERVTALMLALFVSGCEQPGVGEFDFPEGEVQHVVHSEEIEWKPCPPNLPSGCEVAVLEGNPRAPGLFTVRFRVNDEFVMPPHTHPKDERVTIMTGRVSVAFGAKASHDDAKQFGPGDYYVNARGAVHSVWADELSEIQITGLGPWEAHFVE